MEDGTRAEPLVRTLSVQDMIDEIRTEFSITDEEALYITHVTAQKTGDRIIRGTVHAYRDDRLYLEGPYRGQVNGQIHVAYNDLARYEELAESKEALCIVDGSSSR